MAVTDSEMAVQVMVVVAAAAAGTAEGPMAMAVEEVVAKWAMDVRA